MSEITPEQIDAGAKYLRETTQAGKNLLAWDRLPKSAKRKWVALSEGVLRAAARTLSEGE